MNGSTPPIERSIVIGNQLYTVSSEGVMASSLDTLARQAFVSFAACTRAGDRPGYANVAAWPSCSSRTSRTRFASTTAS